MSEQQSKMSTEEVLNTVLEMNRQWAARNAPDRLAHYFHRDMIAACAGESGFRVGQETCVDGWSGFCNAVSNLSFKEVDPLVKFYPENNTAVVAYTYECSFTQAGEHRLLKGRDLFTLVKASGRWQVISDHFS